MRVLLINQFFYPDEAATSQFLTDLAQELARRGHDVEAVCGRARYAGPEKAGPLPGVRIRRLAGTDCHRSGGIAGKALDYATFFAAAAIEIARMPRADVVVVLSTPPMAGWLGGYAKRLGHGRFILWVQDVYPEIAEALGVIRSRALNRVLQAQMGLIYQAADRVVTLGDRMSEALRSRYCLDERLTAVAHWPLTGAPSDRDEERRQRGWQKDFVLLYSGNLGRAHDAGTFLEAFREFGRRHPEARLAVAGAGARRGQVDAFAAANPGLRIELLGHQPRAVLGRFLAAADAHLVSQLPQVDGLVVPSKIYGILESGRPFCFIGGEANEIADLVSRDHVGFRTEPGDAAGLCAAWERLWAEPRLAETMGEAARRLARERFSRAAGLSKLAAIVEEI